MKQLVGFYLRSPSTCVFIAAVVGGILFLRVCVKEAGGAFVFVLMIGMLVLAFSDLLRERREAARGYGRWERTQQGKCPQCEYDVRASPMLCPECGFILKSLLEPLSGCDVDGEAVVRHAIKGVAPKQPYPVDAMLFVFRAFSACKARVEGQEAASISALELCVALRESALDYFEDAEKARQILHSWGIRSSTDAGRIVYGLVDANLIGVSPGDSVDQFADLFTVAEWLGTGD